MTCTVHHYRLQDGTWIATCDLWPSWKHQSAEQDKPGAETSLKRHASRRMRFVHHGWNGRP